MPTDERTAAKGNLFDPSYGANELPDGTKGTKLNPSFSTRCSN